MQVYKRSMPGSRKKFENPYMGGECHNENGALLLRANPQSSMNLIFQRSIHKKQQNGVVKRMASLCRGIVVEWLDLRLEGHIVVFGIDCIHSTKRFKVGGSWKSWSARNTIIRE